MQLLKMNKGDNHLVKESFITFKSSKVDDDTMAIIKDYLKTYEPRYYIISRVNNTDEEIKFRISYISKKIMYKLNLTIHK